MSDGGTPTKNPKYQLFEPRLAVPPAGEDRYIEKMIADLLKNNKHQYAKSVKDPSLHRNGKAHAIRDAHAKSAGILHGTLTVNADIPEDYRQGMFAEPGQTYELIARISTTSGAIRSDQVRGVRGLGLKVLGVEGPRVRTEFPEPNQDFVFVTEPTFPFKGAKDYSTKGMLLAKTLAHLPDRAIIGVNTVLRGVRKVVKAVGGDLPSALVVFAKPNYHVLGQTFYTAAPIRFGDYVAKLSVAPSSTSVKRLSEATISPEGQNALTDAVVKFFASNEAEYVVSVQLCTNEHDMPIENAKKEWSVGASPYQPVAIIRYPKQTAHSVALENFGDDALTFNSWRAIEDHIPLGSINRLKLKVYEASSKFRHDTNGVPRLEPSSLADFPK